MKKKWIWMTAALAFFCMVSNGSAEPIFRIVYNNKGAPPRIMGDGTAIDWLKPGVSLELLKMVEARVGVPFQFKRMPWKRCLYMVEHGAADATFHASYKPDRAKYGVYPASQGALDSTRSIYRSAYVLYAKKGSVVSWDGQMIGNVSRPIGTQLSFAVADDLRKMGYAVEEEAGVITNLNKLTAGRISLYADLELIVDNTLRQYHPRYETVEKLDPPLSEKVYYLLISKTFVRTHAQLTERIWDAIRDVKKTDAYKKMLSKYLE
jgi:polar amino acid transport system substrate-binding protein